MLSAHFALSELVASDTAIAQGIDNTPPDSAKDNLRRLAMTLLDPIRELLGEPVRVNVGYRCPALNQAVGGVAGSAHLTGCAADIFPVVTPLRSAFDVIRASDLPYDQLILELVGPNRGCIHAAIAEEGKEPRRQALIRHGTRGSWTYTAA